MVVGFSCLILLIGFAINLPVFLAVTGAVLAYFFMAADASPIIAAQRIIGAGENVTLLATGQSFDDVASERLATTEVKQ